MQRKWRDALTAKRMQKTAHKQENVSGLRDLGNQRKEAHASISKKHGANQDVHAYVWPIFLSLNHVST